MRKRGQGTPNNRSYRIRSQKSREILDSIGIRLGIKELSDWYRITTKEVRELGGDEILARNGNSLIDSLQHVYDEHNWQRTRFEDKISRLIHDTHRSYMGKIAEKLTVKEFEEWYKISTKRYSKIGRNWNSAKIQPQSR